MNGLTTAAAYVIQTLGSLYLLIVLLRFVLQLVRADFYNPLSQFIVRATSPLLMPLRRVIPGFGGVDLASLVLALLVQLLLMIVILALGERPDGNLLQLLIWALIGVASLFLNIFFFALIISIILSWVAPGTHNPAAQLVHQISEPLLAPIRRFLPNLGGLDISPIFALIGINLLDRWVIPYFAALSGMPQTLAPFL